MPIPTSPDPHPGRFVRALTRYGHVARLTIPPAVAKQLGWCVRDLLVIEVRPDNTLRVSKLDLTPAAEPLDLQQA